MAFWGFFEDDDSGGGPAPDINEFPYYSAAGPGALASSPPSSLPPVRALFLHVLHTLLGVSSFCGPVIAKAKGVPFFFFDPFPVVNRRPARAAAA